MNFIEAIQSGFKRVLDFDGRSSRSEFNYWLLFLFLLQFCSIIIDPPEPIILSVSDVEISELDSNENTVYDPLNSRLFSFLYFAMLLPTTSLAIRRFHDINMSGWYVLLPFTIIGILPYYYFTSFVKGMSGKNKYGFNPLEQKTIFNMQINHMEEEE